MENSTLEETHDIWVSNGRSLAEAVSKVQDLALSKVGTDTSKEHHGIVHTRVHGRAAFDTFPDQLVSCVPGPTSFQGPRANIWDPHCIAPSLVQ